MKKLLLVVLLFLSSYCYGQDTLKVVMLYSDTALTEMVGTDEEGEEYEFLGIDEQCYWRHGYKVGDYYLDADKKRIPDSNVVWMYKKES